MLQPHKDIIVPTEYVIDQQDIENSVEESYVYKTQKYENFGSLVIIYVISLKCLVFWSRSYHERYKHNDFIVPTKYVIYQQDIEVSKNCMFKTQKIENFGSLAPLARHYLYISKISSLLQSKSYHECYNHTRILLYRQNMWLTNKISRSRRIVQSKTQNAKIFGSLTPLARNHLWNFLSFKSPD